MNNKYLKIFLAGFYLPLIIGCRVPAAEQAAPLRASEVVSKIDANGNIMFADETFKQYLLAEHIECNDNLEISAADAAKITELDLDYNEMIGKIGSLADIKFFTALEYLSADEHNFPRADLSANNQLKTVSFRDNPMLAEVVLPKKQTALHELVFDGCVSLQSLNLSFAASLNVLSLSGCVQFTGPLKLSHMKRLNSLSLDKTLVSELDVTRNGALTHFELFNMPQPVRVRLTEEQNQLRKNGGLIFWSEGCSNRVKWLVDDELV